MDIVFAVVAIVCVWGSLFGVAYLSRIAMRLGRRASVAAVTGCYLALAILALLVLGTGRSGIAGAFGMLLPYAMAIGLVALLG